MTKAQRKIADVTAIHANDPGASSIQVVDATSGEVIDRVIEADAEAGTVRRFAVENGVLVREGNAWKVIDEKRAIRLEEISAGVDIAAELAADAEAQA